MTDTLPEFFLWYLRAAGPMTGEKLVDAAKRRGYRFKDDRAFGPVIARLRREGLIECVGISDRRKGHGTSGARVWSIRSIYSIRSINTERSAA